MLVCVFSVAADAFFLKALLSSATNGPFAPEVTVNRKTVAHTC
jgi:hypothetical protein